MPANLRVLRRRRTSVVSTQKITKAMELIAASRIGKAQARMRASQPYAEQLTRALSALASTSNLEHPLLHEREEPKTAAILVVTSDRGLAGGYSSNAIKAANELAELLQEQGKEPKLYLIGRKGVTYYRFRNRPIEAEWTGFSEQPHYPHARDVGEALVRAFMTDAEETVEGPESSVDLRDDSRIDDAAVRGQVRVSESRAAQGGDALAGDTTTSGALQGVDELHIVYTEFVNMVTQRAVAKRIAPLVVEESTEAPPAGYLPEYEFEPDPETLLESLLPQYVTSRLYAALLEASASESAARQRAMAAASDNADELIKGYTRQINQARQAVITQELSEIVGGADALAASR